MTVTSIVFDLDGTLVDSSPDIADALNRAFADLGVRQLTPPEVLAMLGGGPRVLVAKALAAVGGASEGAAAEEAEEEEIDEATIDRLVETYSACYRAEPAARTTFFSDAAEALPALRARGIQLGICTNKRADIAQQVLEQLGVRQLFGAIVGSDTATASKPDPAHLSETIAGLGTDPAACLYVGDTDIDARTAAAAGVRYLHVDWGHDLGDTGLPFTEIRSFGELLGLLDRAG